jgi:hypothetical protein
MTLTVYWNWNLGRDLFISVAFAGKDQEGVCNEYNYLILFIILSCLLSYLVYYLIFS